MSRLPVPGTRRQLWDSRFSLDFKASGYLIRAAGLVGLPQIFTILCWVKFDGLGAFEYLFELGNGGNTNQIRVFRRGDTTGILDVRVTIGASAKTFQTVGAVATGTWLPLVLTRDVGELVSCYLAGVGFGTPGIVTGTFVATAFTIGCDAGTPGAQPLDGKVSTFAIFDKVLPVADVSTYPARAWYKYPSCYLALNPGHAADSAAAGGLIHDWHSRGQDLTPTGMSAGDLAADAP